MLGTLARRKIVQCFEHTVLFHSICQLYVTGPQKLTECHNGHGHFGEVTKSFLDSKKFILKIKMATD